MNKSERYPSGLLKIPEQDGYYWVKGAAWWTIAYYKDGNWYLPDIQGPVVLYITEWEGPLTRGE